MGDTGSRLVARTGLMATVTVEVKAPIVSSGGGDADALAVVKVRR